MLVSVIGLVVRAVTVNISEMSGNCTVGGPSAGGNPKLALNCSPGLLGTGSGVTRTLPAAGNPLVVVYAAAGNVNVLSSTVQPAFDPVGR